MLLHTWPPELAFGMTLFLEAEILVWVSVVVIAGQQIV